jgi:diguanylate cyclase (GGDEF)-like protein
VNNSSGAWDDLILRDPLTGLFNRRAALGHLAERAVGAAPLAAVLLMDLDRFIQVNGAHGVEAGDRVLVDVGRCLAEVAGPGAVVARVGGDEFAVLTPDAAGAPALAEHCRAGIAALRPQGIPVTASVGWVRCDGPPRTGGPEALLRAAGAAMRRAKDLGGDAVGEWGDRA